MAQRKDHIILGGAAGAAIAVWRAPNRKPEDKVFGGLGCIIGGVAGSRMPDILDPPTYPGHRDFGHSISAGITLIKASEFAKDAEASLIAYADEYSLRCEASTNTIDKLAYVLGELSFRMAAGFVPGFIAGYISHLALDGTTKRGLPIV